MHVVEITHSAEIDIHESFRWWHENRSPDQAIRWYRKLRNAVVTLEEFPERCPYAAEATQLGVHIRQLLFGIGKGSPTHRILFIVNDNKVKLLRVLHVSRRPLSDPEELS